MGRSEPEPTEQPKRVGLGSRGIWSLCGMLCIIAGVVQARPSMPGFGVASYQVVGDAIPQPLTAAPGNVVRGLGLLLDRSKGNCVACHAVPLPDVSFHGTLGPDLSTVADRLSMGQMRLRLVDSRLLSEDGKSLMPSFYAVDGLYRVDGAHAGKPILQAQEVEDILALLATFKESP